MKTSPNLDLEFLLNLDTEDQLYNAVSDQFNEITSGLYAAANMELFKQLNIQPKSRVLDLACGTGHLAIEIAKKASQGKVVGVDLSPQMLARAREDAAKNGVKNIEFIERNIREVLPEFKRGDFEVGVSCFALSYLGCDFLLKEFFEILGEKGQIGITTSSVNCLTEWYPLFFEFLQEHGDLAASFEVNEIPNMPLGDEDLKARLEQVGFKNVKVKAIKIPLVFKNGYEAAIFLVSSGWFSNYFFRLKDKKIRRQISEWAIRKVEENYMQNGRLETSLEFLVAWNN